MINDIKQIKKLSLSEFKQMKADYRLSNELWGKFVGGITPEEMHIASS